MEIISFFCFYFLLWTQHDIANYGSAAVVSVRSAQSPPPAHQQASPITPVILVHIAIDIHILYLKQKRKILFKEVILNWFSFILNKSHVLVLII